MIITVEVKFLNTNTKLYFLHCLHLNLLHTEVTIKSMNFILTSF
jgi:hypothetical protein